MHDCDIHTINVYEKHLLWKHILCTIRMPDEKNGTWYAISKLQNMKSSIIGTSEQHGIKHQSTRVPMQKMTNTDFGTAMPPLQKATTEMLL